MFFCKVVYNKKNNGLVKKESSSKKYSSPPLIFKKANRDTSSQMDYDTPTSWSNIEDLVDTGNDDDNFTNTNNNINNNGLFFKRSTKASVFF